MLTAVGVHFLCQRGTVVLSVRVRGVRFLIVKRRGTDVAEKNMRMDGALSSTHEPCTMRSYNFNVMHGTKKKLIYFVGIVF